MIVRRVGAVLLLVLAVSAIALPWPPLVLQTITFAMALLAAGLLWREATVSSPARAAFLQRLFESLPTPVSVKNEDLQFVEVNESFVRVSRGKREVLVGSSASELVGDRDGERAEVLDRLVLETGQPQVANEWLASVDGTRHYYRVTKTRIEGPEGAPAVVTAYEDLTLLHEEQERQSALRAFLQRVFDMVPNPLYIKDRQHRYVMTNRAHVETLGVVSSGEVIGKRVGEFAPAMTHSVEAAEDNLFSQQVHGIHEEEQVHVDVDGRRSHSLVRKALTTGPDGAPVVIGINTDITELRETERDLRRTLHRFSMLMQNAPLGIALLDVRGRFLTANPYLLGLGGYTQDELLDLSYRDLLFDASSEREQAKMLELFRQGYCEPFPCMGRRRDGSHVPLMLGAALVTGPEMQPQIWGLVQDVSAQRAADAELRRHRDHLRELVREQTADLMGAKEAAERASEAKSTFLANMSHELRTPMHAVLSFALLGEQRAETIPAARLRDYFSRIRSSGERLMVLLNDLLDLSKLESGTMPISREPVDLREVVGEVLREFEALLIANSLKLTFAAAPDVPLVLADRLRIAQVIRNLLANAIKFSLQERRIAVTLHAQDNVVECVVADEGVGIAPGDLDTIFDKFVQGSRTRTGAGGTGLGLAISREIVAAHGGEIFARHGQVCGAEFVVRLPRLDAGRGPANLERAA
ncbi:PAS domain S-box protein [Uliginosibacterium sp. sgz301328]|uniref:sensor histidine kinase n=1 Tax=Uliginosibacterium sp. sgz301328 TaxID=3243764 RepID=UPI00359EAA93